MPRTLVRIALFCLAGLILYWVQMPSGDRGIGPVEVEEALTLVIGGPEGGAPTDVQTTTGEPLSEPLTDAASPAVDRPRQSAVGDEVSGGGPARVRSELVQLDRTPGPRPVAYRLDLRVDPSAEVFGGHVEIDLILAVERTEIRLNGEGLGALSAFVRDQTGARVDARYREEEGGIAVLELARPVAAGPVTLRIDYTADFAAGPEGLFRFTDDGRAYALTQFEPIAARRAFPGFDWPRHKTPFSLTLHVPEGLTAIANMPRLSEGGAGGPPAEQGWRTVRFRATPPLPTYLVAFAVGPYEVIKAAAVPPTDLRAAPVPIRGVATAGETGHLTYALEATPGLVTAFESYFAESHPFPKIDLVAVPHFRARGMENPGAIVYHQSVTTVDAQSPLPLRRRFFEGHARHLARQWFGNLVTPVSWSDVWLNEAFAVWAARKVLHRHLKDAPDFARMEFDRATQRQAYAVMGGDSRTAARPVYQPISSVGDIAAAFDPAVSQKGAALLAMAERHLGAEKFRSGVRTYLTRHRGGTADTAAFLGALAGAANDDALASSLWSFLRQPGLPALKVSTVCPPGGGVNVTLAQSPYRPLRQPVADDAAPQVPPEAEATVPESALDPGGAAAQERPDPQQVPQQAEATWEVPVCVAFLGADGGRERQCMLLRRQTQTFYARKSGCPKAVHPDPGGAGYYRWSMDTTDWQALASAFTRLTPAEALSFASNLSAALRSGTLSLADYLRLIGPVAAHPAADVATTPLADIAFLLRHLPDGKARDLITARARALYDARLGKQFESGKGARTLRRALLSFYLLALGDDAVTARLADEGRGMLEALAEGTPGALLAPDADLALLAAVRADDGAGGALIDRLGTLEPGEKAAALRALTQSGRPYVATRLLAEDVAGSLSVPDLMGVLEDLMENPATRPPAADWLQENVDRLATGLPDGRRREVIVLPSGYCSAEGRAAARALFEPRAAAIENGARTLAATLEEIDVCVALKAALTEQVRQMVSPEVPES